MHRKVKAFEKLKTKQRDQIAAHLREQRKVEVASFAAALRVTLTRQIASVYVLPLHGSPQMLADISNAIAFIEKFDEASSGDQFARYEVGIRYSNGDEVRGQFKDKATAIVFLRAVK